jgi:hypothetical protein
MCFSKSAKPQIIVQEPITPPALGDPEVRAAENTIRRRGASSKGFSYAFATSPLGDLTQANIGYTTLGGTA